MTKPIHDWRDRSKYPRHPLTEAPAAFIEERQKRGQSKDEMRSALWHWEFLRRHKLYQDHWKDDSDEYFRIFGIVGTSRPDPKTDFPIDLMFRYEMFDIPPRNLWLWLQMPSVTAPNVVALFLIRSLAAAQLS